MHKENFKDKKEANFLSKVAHELKSPIHGIMSLSDFLQNNWENINEQDKIKCITEISKSSQNLNLLINSLFDLARFSDRRINFTFQEMDFREATKEAIENVGVFIINNDELAIEYSDDVSSAIILADRVWFKQLITNILINSIKFTKEGIISINVSEEKFDHKPYYKFSISDEGIGVPDEEISKIFDEFSIGSKQHDNNSSGLGLAICEEIVKAHGGEIWVFNNNKRGITVEFTIPNTVISV